MFQSWNKMLHNSIVKTKANEFFQNNAIRIKCLRIIQLGKNNMIRKNVLKQYYWHKNKMMRMKYFRIIL